jgi:endogenous inhibitor of DNA gyrase (YacG/DUF329 family)
MTAASPIDLNAWHRQLHAITGEMALHWRRVTPVDLHDWAAELRSVAEQMAAAAGQGGVAPS